MGVLALIASAIGPPGFGQAQAAPPQVTVGATGARIRVTSASLSEVIDAFARAANFRVTYEGARPTGMIFNAEIDTPSVAQTLFRLIDGQNLNYAVLFDLTGKRVTSLMVLGAPAKVGGTAAAAVGASRPQPFTPPRVSRADTPVVEDDPPADLEPEPSPQTTPTPPPIAPQRGVPGGPPPAFQNSPFAPRPPYGTPFAAPPSPSPSAAPVPSPSPSP